MKKLMFMTLICAFVIAAGCSKKPNDAALIGAVTTCDAKLTDELLKQGANPNALLKDNDTKEIVGTVLSYAILSVENHYEWGDSKQPAACESIIASLLAAGADPNLQYQEGFTAVNSAAGIPGGKGIEILNKLLKAGANVNHVNNGGMNAISDAIMPCNTTMVKALLKAGVNPNVSSKSGSTPLSMAVLKNDPRSAQIHKSCKGGTYEIVKDLLEAGANPNIKSIQGDTALSYAEKKGYKNIANLLKKYKARS
jgi:ankyrin repeat protein